jgi:hypothetical protein
LRKSENKRSETTTPKLQSEKYEGNRKQERIKTCKKKRGRVKQTNKTKREIERQSETKSERKV